MTDEIERMERQIAGFEKAWDYDASYMRDLLRAGPEVLRKFQGMMSIVDVHAAPKEALFAAQTLGVLDGDCEPCVQVGVDIALAGGLDPAVVRAVLTGDQTAMSDTVLLAWRFARASLAKDPAGLEPYRREILARWGEKGLTAIALSITVGRMYPTLKYPLGYGHPCQKATVAGEVVLLRPEAVAA
jgi:hypothetical protein